MGASQPPPNHSYVPPLPPPTLFPSSQLYLALEAHGAPVPEQLKAPAKPARNAVEGVQLQYKARLEAFNAQRQPFVNRVSVLKCESPVWLWLWLAAVAFSALVLLQGLVYTVVD
jgi:hypothetical protein